MLNKNIILMFLVSIYFHDVAGGSSARIELTTSFAGSDDKPVTKILICPPGTPSPLPPGVELHSNPKEACKVLDKIGGDFSKLKPNDVVCTFEYSPVTVKAKGVYNGRSITPYERKTLNKCYMKSQTENMFE